jgi:hypothetical protein
MARKITATHDGKEQTLTVPEWAEIHGVHPNRIYKRTHRGMSAEEAVSKPFASRNPPNCQPLSEFLNTIVTAQWEGEELSMSVEEWSELTEIAIKNIRKRVHWHGMPIEKAVTMPLQKRM